MHHLKLSILCKHNYLDKIKIKPKIDFRSKDIDILYTPHNPNFGGNVTTQTWPFTGTGFTSERNLTIVPEWKTPEKVDLVPQVGSTIHEVIDGKDVIVSIYDHNPITKKIGWKDLR